MGRQRKNNAEYFSHDADASDDEKLMYLEARFGLIGYALYFKILEWLCRCDGFETAYNEMTSAVLAKRFGVSPEQLSEFIVAATKSDVAALHLDNGRLWSHGLKKRLEPLLEKRIKDAERIAQRRAETAQKTPKPLNGANVAATMQQSKDKDKDRVKDKEEKGLAADAAKLPLDDEFESVGSIEFETEEEKPQAKIVSLEAEKKKKATSKGRGAGENSPSLVNRLRDVFEEEHHRHFPHRFTWAGKDFKALKTLGQHMAQQCRDFLHIDEATDEQIADTFRDFLQKTVSTDPWYLRNCFTPSALSGQYSNILNKLNHASTNHTGGISPNEREQRLYNATVAYLEASRRT